jgi:segregation and condensation protein A
MSDVLATLQRETFTDFMQLFQPDEGRMGVTVTFIAILELVREGLIEIVQREAYAPLHVRAAPPPASPDTLIENAEQQQVEAEDARLLQAPQPPEDDATDDGESEGGEPDALEQGR